MHFSGQLCVRFVLRWFGVHLLSSLCAVWHYGAAMRSVRCIYSLDVSVRPFTVGGFISRPHMSHISWWSRRHFRLMKIESASCLVEWERYETAAFHRLPLNARGRANTCRACRRLACGSRRLGSAPFSTVSIPLRLDCIFFVLLYQAVGAADVLFMRLLP